MHVTGFTFCACSHRQIFWAHVLGMPGTILIKSYSTIVLYNRDHKSVGVAHDKITQKPASLFPDDDEAVLVGITKPKQVFR